MSGNKVSLLRFFATCAGRSWHVSEFLQFVQGRYGMRNWWRPVPIRLRQPFSVVERLGLIESLRRLSVDCKSAPIRFHAPEGCCAQCCGYLDLTYQHTDYPFVMTTEVLEIVRIRQHASAYFSILTGC